MRVLVKVSIVLAFVVVVLGAYTRLTDAGLGCPDWPGCYGHLTVPNESQIPLAQARFPEQAIEPHKAWNEMIHRYFAGALGLLILVIGIVSIVKDYSVKTKMYCSGLFLLVCFQALLGMLTVTMSLMPAIVMGHLLGGFSIVVLLVLLDRNLKHSLPDNGYLPKAVWFCLFVLVFQISLGGWTSANYAALACTELPVCESGWQQRLDFNAFHLISPESDNYQYGVLSYSARMTIHIAHRFWAVITVISLLSWIAFCLKHLKQQKEKSNHYQKRLFQLNLALLAALFVQFSLGIANIVLSLPLVIAVMHNAVALILLSTFVLSLYYFYLCEWCTFAQHKLNFKAHKRQTI